jgi:hypothetical protein
MDQRRPVPSVDVEALDPRAEHPTRASDLERSAMSLGVDDADACCRNCKMVDVRPRQRPVRAARPSVVQRDDVLPGKLVQPRGDGPLSRSTLGPHARRGGLIAERQEKPTELRVLTPDLVLAACGALVVLALGGRAACARLLGKDRRGVSGGRLRRLNQCGAALVTGQAADLALRRVPQRSCSGVKGSPAPRALVTASQCQHFHGPPSTCGRHSCSRSRQRRRNPPDRREGPYLLPPESCPRSNNVFPTVLRAAMCSPLPTSLKINCHRAPRIAPTWSRGTAPTSCRRDLARAEDDVDKLLLTPMKPLRCSASAGPSCTSSCAPARSLRCASGAAGASPRRACPT